MPNAEPAIELHEGFSEPRGAARPWAEEIDILTGSEMFWLSTVRRDGRPHVTPLPRCGSTGQRYWRQRAAADANAVTKPRRQLG